MLSLKNLILIILVTLIVNGCKSNPSIDLTDRSLYLIAIQQRESKYKEVICQFKEDQKVEMFYVTNLRPMTGDVVIGIYQIKNNQLALPKIGRLEVRTAKDGFDLYNNVGKLKYKLTSGECNYIPAYLRNKLRYKSI